MYSVREPEVAFLKVRLKWEGEMCSSWGDEYVGIEEGIYGSDSFMKTGKTADGEFFDVSQVPGKRPEGVVQLGGGVERFLEFLKEQAQIE